MKRYICISDYFHEDELTIDKIYDGKVEGDYITVKNNNGYNWKYYAPYYFKEYEGE